MKKTLLFAAVAAMFGLTSCQEDDFASENQNTGEGLVFKASLENTATRTTLTNEGTAGYKVSWEATDTISVNGVKFVPTIDPTNPASATFSKASNEAKADPTAPYKVYYPASIYDGTTATLPATQTYTADGSVAGILPMYAESSDLNLSFKNLCGLMKFTLKGTEKVQYITLTDDTKALSGKFTVTDNAAVLDAEAKGGVKLYCGDEGVQLDETDGKTFYVAVPAGSYDKLHIEYNTVNYAKNAKLTANKTATVERNKVYPFTQTPTFKADYFYFKANTAGSTVTLNKKDAAPDAGFQTSTDGVSWTDYTISTEMTLANVGDKIYFRANGTNTQLASSDNLIHSFSGTGSVDVGGNVMYLLNGTNPGISFSATYALDGLFSSMKTLQSASDLILPATTLAQSCYHGMFERCEALTTVPELPATTLTGECYANMFKGCTSLTTAPELPATTLANNCYSGMFKGCTALTTAPELPAATLAEGCYSSIFANCTSLETAPELPATTLAKSCYSSIFANCTSLETAPELPATTLAESCYFKMFEGCTSLTTAPELPATTLAQTCYKLMFNNCTALTKVTMKATDVSASNCLYNWLKSAGTSGTSKLYVDKSMTINSTITSNRGNFTIVAYN